MTANEIIDAIQKITKSNLSKRERNWIKDNTVKWHLYVNPNDCLIKFDALNKFHTIIQNGKSRKIGKVDRSTYAIVVSVSGCCKVLLPE